MPITYGNTGQKVGSGGQNAQWTHNSDSDFLVMMVACQGVVNGTPTYNRVPMTLAHSAGSTRMAYVYYLINPPQGSYDFLVIFNGTIEHSTASISLIGVDTASPKGNIGQDVSLSNVYSGVSSTAAGSVIIDSLLAVGTSPIPPVPSPGSGQVAISNSKYGNYWCFGFSRKEAGAGGTVPMSWTGSYNVELAHVAVEFKQAPNPPSISTGSIQAVFSATAKVIGNEVTSEGDESVTDRGVVYATTTSPEIADNKVSVGTGLGSFDASITGLSENTLYYARAFATSGIDTSYGSEISFKTDKNVAGTIINLDNPVIYS